MDGIGREPGIRPRPTLGRRLDAIARACFPTTCTILLMLLTALPFGLLGQAQLLPAVALCCVWFWSLMRPGAMPPASVFLVGLLYDLLGYLPLGVGILTLLIVHGLALRSRFFIARHGFLLGWVSFAPIALAGSGLTWALGSALSMRLLPISPAAFQAALSIAVYPTLGILFARAHDGLADPERA